MNLLIVEDDAIQLNGLKHIITEHYPDTNIHTASSYKTLIYLCWISISVMIKTDLMYVHI